MQKLLIASPICKKPSILKHFLETINQQKINNDIEIHYYFVDDNENNDSSVLIEQFKIENKNVIVKKASDKKIAYEDGNYTHNWNEYLIWRLADIKNKIIDFAKYNNFNYIFFVDSDLILNPNTIQHLISLNLDIVSEVFWTQWTPNQIELPQIWLYDHYELVPKNRLEALSEEETRQRFFNFINKLRTPGVYEVGGLGACTLISQYAINKGVNFSEIKNISFWGEDRAFCIRAHALGLNLYADTTYPPLHIYRDDDLYKVKIFKDMNNLN